MNKNIFLILTLFSSLVFSEKLYLQCLSAPNDGFDITYIRAAFLETDGYRSLKTKSCKNVLRDDTCGDIDNFKYCKSPKESFILRSLGDDFRYWVASNRCDSGFKKFERIGDIDDEIYLYDEKMAYQIKNQIWAGTKIESHPVFILSKEDSFYYLRIEDFIEDLWLEEWTREDIDVSFFTVNEEKAKKFETYCVLNENFTSVDSLKKETIQRLEIKKEQRRQRYLSFNDPKINSDEEIIDDSFDRPRKKELEMVDNDLELNSKSLIKTIPKLIKNGKLIYPSLAEDDGIKGEVKVLFDVDEKGNAKNIRIKESTNQIFNDSAINAIKSSKYKPATDSNSKAVYFSNLSIVVEFNLD